MKPDFWDERYRAKELAYGDQPNDFVREVAGRIPNGPVLCLAEGQGRNAVYLAAQGHEVTAVDFSLEGIRRAEELAAARGVRITTVHADLASWQPDRDDFAGVVAIFAHLLPEIRTRVHGWVPRVLRPGGVFVLEAYRPEQLAHGTGGPRDPAMLMTLAGLRAELAPLSFEIGREVERDIHEGPFHGGRSATVQVLAHRA